MAEGAICSSCRPFRDACYVVDESCGGGGERKEFVTAFYALCCFPNNRRQLMKCRAVKILVSSLNSGIERASEVFGFISKM